MTVAPIESFATHVRSLSSLISANINSQSQSVICKKYDKLQSFFQREVSE
uniref:Uncharacterized protein n=1 Tax=Rhizophagus irregularis (strain DAOM 181602 / DAOM 197198 / MUCL 43194) TaxID=747089 RepID=U9V797_RHIID